MPEIIYEFIIAYIIYKLVFGFVVPVYRTGKMMKDSMSKMQEDMSRAQEQFYRQQEQQQSRPSTEKPRGIDDDYIDYEEVK
jgi:hypothetical protein